ncbi:conjugal transfer protein TrbD [Desulfovibrio sp. JC010]|uniref:conjugal transfer protein TrbD n=1 Tax=Desulfovibrio sp. JC010 TaxID=2593641 RepID=UPI0013D07638|nr:conjugal transfer protein TrbD [Desulfovibrio sp. JC010]NDV28782.1 conjugal transfer protein TrbD [Desulfovibrio sp. JC010]
MSGRKIPIHASLYRPSLVMGAEREPLLYSALFAILIALGGFTLYAGGAALVFWVVTVFILQKNASFDPQLSKIGLRHFNQQNFYAARSTPWQIGGAKLK